LQLFRKNENEEVFITQAGREAGLQSSKPASERASKQAGRQASKQTLIGRVDLPYSGKTSKMFKNMIFFRENLNRADCYLRAYRSCKSCLGAPKGESEKLWDKNAISCPVLGSLSG
jgi:hypothetical protein